MYSTTPLKAVCIFDDAIDQQQSNVVEYAKTRDLTHLKFFPDAKPTYYYIERVPRQLMVQFVCPADSDQARNMRAFAVGVAAVENLVTEDGQVLPRWEPQNSLKLASGNNTRSITDKELELFSTADILEMGEVAYWRGFLRPGSEGCYQVPHSSSQAWALRASHLAAKNRKSAAQSSEGPKEPPQVPAKKRKPSVKRSDKATDATVGEK